MIIGIVFIAFLLPGVGVPIDSAKSTSKSQKPKASFDDNTSIIKANWLYVGLGDVDTGELPRNKIVFSSGGESFTEFENLGVFSVTDDAILYKARAKYEFSITAHTIVGIRNEFPNLNLDKHVKELFLAIIRAKMYGNFMETYSAEWNQLDYGGNVNLFEYSVFLPVTVGIKELTGMNGSVTLGNATYHTPYIKGDVLKVTVANLTSSPIGVYNDTFENLSNIDEGKVSLVEMDDFDSDQQKIINYYNDYGLGWQAGPIQRGATITQSKVGGSQIGTGFNNPNPANNRMFTFDLYTLLAPETYEYVQYNHIRKAGVVFWEWGFWAGNLDAVYGPASSVAPKRVVGAHVCNFALRWTFDVDVEFVASIPTTAELSRTILNDPYLIMGDWVWDGSIVGDYDVEPPLDPYTFEDFMNDLLSLLVVFAPLLILIVIIIVIIIAAYISFVKVIPKRIKKSVKKRKKKKREMEREEERERQHESATRNYHEEIYDRGPYPRKRRQEGGTQYRRPISNEPVTRRPYDDDYDRDL